MSGLGQKLLEGFPNLEVGRSQRRGAGTEEEGQARNYPRSLDDLVFLPPLFDYQSDLVEQVVEKLGAPGRYLVSLPTGGGKTRTAMMACLEAVRLGKAKKILWLAPTMELLAQAEGTLEKLWMAHRAVPYIEIHRELGSVGTTLAPVKLLFTTPQGIYAKRDRKKFLADWDLVVFDEAHQLGARTYRAAIEALESGNDQLLLLGLSATPGRVDDEETEQLVEWFGGDLLTSKRLRPNPIEVLQRRGVLSRLKFEVIDSGKWELESPHRVSLRCAQLLVELGKAGHRTLYFGQSVEEAELVADALTSAGVEARPVSSRTSDADRELWLRQFADGSVGVITNHRLLATGYDCPAVSHVVLGAKVSSPIQFEQIVGRGARGPRTGGSKVGMIHQIHDHLDLHGLPSSYYRFSSFDWHGS